MEVYYKHTKDIVEYKDGANFIGSPYTETSILQGTQKAYGEEFMLQKTSGRLDGWISYAYSRSLVQVKGSNEFESINRGDPYPSNFDRPHVLNLIWSYHINRRFTFSSNMVYMSGRPVTFPSSLYYINEIVYIDYYAKNQVRVPDYWTDTEVIRSDILDYYFEVQWFDSHLERMLNLLEQRGELDDTIIVVTSDNGMPFPRAKVNLYDPGVRMPLAIRWGR